MTRKSKRELRRDVAQLDATDAVPDAGLTSIFEAVADGGEGIEPVDREQRLYRIDGELRRVPEALLDVAGADS